MLRLSLCQQKLNELRLEMYWLKGYLTIKNKIFDDFNQDIQNVNIKKDTLIEISDISYLD